MEFQEFWKQKERMCQTYSDCEKCKIENHPISCGEEIKGNPQRVEKIVEKWAAEHPILTNRDKFIEIFGNKMSCADKVRNVLANMSNGEKYTDNFIKTVIVHYDNWLKSEYKSLKKENKDD